MEGSKKVWGAGNNTPKVYGLNWLDTFVIGVYPLNEWLI